MTIQIEIENMDQSYHIVSGLLDERERLERYDRDTNSVDTLLEQFEGTSCHDIIAKNTGLFPTAAELSD